MFLWDTFVTSETNALCMKLFGTRSPLNQIEIICGVALFLVQNQYLLSVLGD
jgi:hypothetical protein